MMRISDFILIILVVALAIGTIVYIKGNAQYNLDKEEWETTKEQLQENIDKLEIAIKDEEKKASDALVRANKWRDKAEEIETQLSVERIEFARKLEAIATMAPDQLVIAHHFHLSTDSTQVWLNQMGLQFTLDAARVNLRFLDEHRFYLKTEKPKLESLIGTKNNEIGELRLSNTGLSNSNKMLYLEIDDLKAQVGGEHTLRLKAERLVGFKLFSTEAAIGAVIGVALGYLLSSIF